MQAVSQALDEVKELYLKVVGEPVPELQPGSFTAFPPGVDPLEHAVREVRQLKQLTEQIGPAPRPVSWIPAADSFASADAFIVRLEVPGVKKEDLKVFLAGGECVVGGRRAQPEGEDELRPVAVERPWGEFERRFVLPPGAHPEKVTAKYADGLLEVRIGIDGAGKPREMKVELA